MMEEAEERLFRVHLVSLVERKFRQGCERT